MNRDEMARVVQNVLARMTPLGRTQAAHYADLAVGALVAAGCVPSDELTQAARDACNVYKQVEHRVNPSYPRLHQAIARLRAAVTPDERNEP